MKKDHHEWDIRLKDAAFWHRAGQNVANFNKAIREIPASKRNTSPNSTVSSKIAARRPPKPPPDAM